MTPRNRSETPIRLTVQGSSRAVCIVNSLRGYGEGVAEVRGGSTPAGWTEFVV